jgi:hypothetical protein
MFARHDMQYHGQMALQIALLVAFTQLIPEHQVQVMGVIKARVKVRPLQQPLSRLISLYSGVANGVLDNINHTVLYWLPMSLDPHPVWLVCQLGVPSLLQEEPGVVWCRYIRRPE